jgi:hypothetical protein
MKTTFDKDEPTPPSLAGFQLLVSQRIQDGDLLIPGDSLSPEDWFWADYSIGEETSEAGTFAEFRVYRKLPTPRHLERCPDTGELEPTHRAAPAKAATNDDGKPALAHIPTAALYAIANAQAYGAKKYGDFNNFRKGMEVTRNLSCALRHIHEFLDGSNADHESGLNPLDHAIARLAFVLQNLKDGTAIDDRFKKGGRA